MRRGPRIRASGPLPRPRCVSSTARRASLTRVRRSILSTTRYASVMPDCAPLRTASARASSTGAVSTSHLGLPASRASASMASMAACIRSWPNMTASSITDSGSIFASDSTISTAFFVPATTRSRSDAAVCSKVGLRTNSPPMYPTRAAPTGPSNGRPDTASAADAPTSAGMSGSISGSSESTRAITCTSLRKPSGNNGRNGRSMRRDVSVSFSVGRPSRLKKPPGILPAAYVFST